MELFFALWKISVVGATALAVYGNRNDISGALFSLIMFPLLSGFFYLAGAFLGMILGAVIAIVLGGILSLFGFPNATNSIAHSDIVSILPSIFGFLIALGVGAIPSSKD